MKQNNAGRRANTNPALALLNKLLGNKRLLLAVIAAVLVLILLISSAANRSKAAKLEDEITALQTTISQLEHEKAGLDAQLQQQTAATADAIAVTTKITKAMDLFWQIDESYVLSRYSRARELIRILESQELAPALPTTSTTDNGRFSPYDRYAEICEALKEPYGAGVKQ